jgi:hypothetical protein
VEFPGFCGQWVASGQLRRERLGGLLKFHTAGRRECASIQLSHTTTSDPRPYPQEFVDGHGYPERWIYEANPHPRRAAIVPLDPADLGSDRNGPDAQNQNILEIYSAVREDVLATSERQTDFFYKIFPEQVDVGPNKPNTLDWLIGRTRDGTGLTAPRELIHLLTSLRNVQVRRLEKGDPEPDSGRLFSRGVFKEALVEVSVTRLEQTLYAEYPDLKEWIEKLRNEKTQQSVASLVIVWKVPDEQVLAVARRVVEVGFFEERPPKDNPVFWVPFLSLPGCPRPGARCCRLNAVRVSTCFGWALSRWAGMTMKTRRAEEEA